jgi:hypothetical protein
LRGAFHAVDAHARERSAEAATEMFAFATVGARERDARNALHRFGEVAVGKLADVFGNDAVDGGVASRFCPSAVFSDPRKPVTTTSSSSCVSDVPFVAVCAIACNGSARAALESASDIARRKR